MLYLLIFDNRWCTHIIEFVPQYQSPFKVKDTQLQNQVYILLQFTPRHILTMHKLKTENSVSYKLWWLILFELCKILHDNTPKEINLVQHGQSI